MSKLKWDKEFALEQAADDVELLEELVIIFKDSFKSDLGLIETGLAEGSADKICGAAHSIKGAAASLGMMGVSEIALAIEDDSRAGGIEVAKQHIEELQELMEEVWAL